MEENSLHQDLQLFIRIAEGDENAFRQVFHHYNRALYPFVFSLVKSDSDAKEIMQEVFLKLWLNRTSLPGIINPGGWLHTVTANTAYSYLRMRARYELRLRNAMPAGDTDEDPAEKLDAKWAQALIAEAVDQLPPRRRQVFQLSRMEGLSRKEIAVKMGISENTVRNQLVEAVDFVQDYLRKHGPVYIPVLLLLLRDL